MGTTIDLPEEIHVLARQLAHDSNRSMSDVIAELMRRGMGHGGGCVEVDSRGLPEVSVGRPITVEDVRSLVDDDDDDE